ncbi:citrulline utilization hydrolase CtlX [Filimonas lacunae]|nr:arginine deiminase-related protein [Filimonas lacunae]
MIRPVQFTYNEQTAVNNAFQQTGKQENAQEKALEEFDRFAAVLQKNGIKVTVINDTPQPHTPDSIFPNNWISFHEGRICLYPMYAPNRRQERKPAVIAQMQEACGPLPILDFSYYELQNVFLEGTGSMVLDRVNRKAYACLSPRTNERLFRTYCEQMNYTPVVFHATDANGQQIYHTNVVMCIGSLFAVICLDAIPDEGERQYVVEQLKSNHKEIIDISLDQMNHFAGNMLQVHSRALETCLIMSTQAYQSLTEEQIKQLGVYNNIIHSPLDTIETNGGGSARCMLAEVFD